MQEKRIYNFGFAIHKLRTDRGIGIKELATKAGVSYSMISMIERNQRTNPGSQQLARIADALGITKQYIFDLAELFPKECQRRNEIRERRQCRG